MAKVYVKTNEKSIITEINSDIFLESVEGYVLIDEGEGDRYAHAQGNYFEHGLLDERGRNNYKLQDGCAVEITEAEKEVLHPVRPATKSIDEEQDEMLAELAYQVSLMELGGM